MEGERKEVRLISLVPPFLPYHVPPPKTTASGQSCLSLELELDLHLGCGNRFRSQAIMAPTVANSEVPLHPLLAPYTLPTPLYIVPVMNFL